MTSPKLDKKRRQQVHAREVRGFVAFYFYPLEKKSTHRVFRLFFRWKLSLHPFQDQINTLSWLKS